MSPGADVLLGLSRHAARAALRSLLLRWTQHRYPRPTKADLRQLQPQGRILAADLFGAWWWRASCGGGVVVGHAGSEEDAETAIRLTLERLRRCAVQ